MTFMVKFAGRLLHHFLRHYQRATSWASFLETPFRAYPLAGLLNRVA